jgi:hypothetical protein
LFSKVVRGPPNPQISTDPQKIGIPVLKEMINLKACLISFDFLFWGWVGVTSHKNHVGNMVTLQLYRRRKNSRAPFCKIVLAQSGI